jgi:glycosyltransferase involved in cell wall biosynthesis
MTVSPIPRPIIKRASGGVRAPLAQERRPSVGFVSTFPPTRCGLATFTASLAGALAPVWRTGVVSCVDELGETASSPAVVFEWVRGSRGSLRGAARRLEGYDTVIVQHEFGLFSGPDGEDIVELVEAISTRVVIVVFHTVLDSPSANQRRIVEQLAAVADRVVVQSEVARRRLLAAHHLGVSRVVVIQHGAPANIVLPGRDRHARRPVILTWGLLGPGKGIEHAIRALAELRDLEPGPRYVVLGQTHPNIVRQSGEAYRESLQALAAELGVEDLVEFDDAYRDTADVLAVIRDADVVLLPYLSRDQVVSGVLVEAIASGKPVVSTAFPHAVELLSAGSGIVVPHEDPAAMASALRTLLTDRAAARVAAAVARRQAASLTWETVAGQYAELASGVRRARALAG